MKYVAALSLFFLCSCASEPTQYQRDYQKLTEEVEILRLQVRKERLNKILEKLESRE